MKHIKWIVCLLLVAVLTIDAFAVGKYGMVPIYGRDIADGTYPITVESSSPFFKIIRAELIVSGDVMTASITIGSHSYPYVFLGTAEEAEQQTTWIEAVEDEDNAVFTFPVKALNTPIACAAYSKRKKRWYDRDLLFEAASLPKEAIAFDLPDYDKIEAAIQQEPQTETKPTQVYGEVDPSSDAMEVPYEDGEYSIEVSMTGGTGRAAISSPTLMIVENGKAYAKILWSSPNYDWMQIAGKTYYNANNDGGNSYFIVPIPDMDRIVEIIADTTAMGDPVAIAYSLTFYADTIGNKGLIPQEAAKKVILLAAIIIATGGIANWFIKRKKKA